MYVCYVDESGTPDIPGNTSHFVLAGISIPISYWKIADRSVSLILNRYGLGEEEFHTAWILRSYIEQSRIADFEQLDRLAREAEVERLRNAHLLQLQRTAQSGRYRQAKKNFHHTRAYIHLTLDERKSLVREVADCVANWGYARLFAECIDKLHFNPTRTTRTVDEQAFEQVISRFEQYLANVTDSHGLVVHDMNETVARKHTDLMRRFHRAGTLWTQIERTVETPLFVNSALTRMVQVADLCAYALRRYLENNETDLFRRIFSRADRIQNTVVGVRHFAGPNCGCDICIAHRRPQGAVPAT